jgi:hypothetical protein
MKTYTVRLFKDAADEAPAQKWAVIASSPDEAKGLLKAYLGPTPNWPKIEVALAAAEVNGRATVIGRVPMD